jgi:hypothetical protein
MGLVQQTMAMRLPPKELQNTNKTAATLVDGRGAVRTKEESWKFRRGEQIRLKEI